MTVTVVIPWRPGCPQREAALNWVLDRWRAAGHEPILGRASDDPWCKASAVADALPQAGGDVLVVADADVWCDGIDKAARAVTCGAPWAIPHGPVHRLASAATDAVLAGGHLGGDLDQPPYRGFEGGGMVVVRRELYDQAPMDRRFAGWGQEDEAWALALRMLAGPPWRGTALLWHLWHPPQQRASRRWGNSRSRSLYQRYRSARTPEQMRALISEVV